MSITGKERVTPLFCEKHIKSNGEISLFIGKYKLAVSIFLLTRKILFKKKLILFFKLALAFDPKINFFLFFLPRF